MYGTIPIAASFFQKGMKDDMLAAFMMSSILLNPQLLITSGILGAEAVTVRVLKNLGRNIRATAPWFIVGVLLSALFQRYVPSDAFAELFGEQERFGVLLTATIGVSLYACGGGTVPLLQQWLASGMSMGSAAAFMITGSATKITNLGALKIVLGMKRFVLYLAYVILISLVIGLAVDRIL